MPHSVSVCGFIGHAFINKTKFCIILDQFFLAGQHKTFSALLSCILDCTLDQLSCISGSVLTPNIICRAPSSLCIAAFSYISSVCWLINVSLTFIILYNTVLDNERKSYMNAIVIYYSRSGNTEKIAKQLQSDLGVTCMVSLNCTFVFFYFLQSIMIFSHRSYPSSELFSDNV